MTRSCAAAACSAALPDRHLRTLAAVRRLGMAAALLCAAAVTAGSGIAMADPAPTPAPTPAPGISTDGTFAVGTDIAPGVYASQGPVAGEVCYWRRIGADDATLNNAMTKQPQIIVIEATDVAFKTKGCQPWQPSDAQPPGQTSPWLSQLQLRHQLDVLNGLAGQSGNGQLPPY